MFETIAKQAVADRRYLHETKSSLEASGKQRHPYVSGLKH